MYLRVITPQFLLCKGINGIRALSSDASSILDNARSSETAEIVPILTPRTLNFPPRFEKPREAWVENMDTAEERKLGIINLHPEIFGAPPRIDIIHENARWQRMYRFVSYAHTKTRAEVRGGGRKPWPQKGLGRARHGSIRSPIWKGGGVAHGPRSPTPHFYMLPFYTRIHGLISMLSVKLAQDDLHIVSSLEIPNDDPKFIEDLLECRNWGPSVLFVDELDIMPRNITAATDAINHVNLMPAYGLNVYSMLKHNTLVLTLAAVNHIEEKLLYHIHRSDSRHMNKKFRIGQVG
ncbi:39S ribosomal protein L4, mitochondrial [Schistocerca cancellata]|uniref:39S ribosomal protein L4, mitochondrial n=1 Tax=Schistocerca cancellata TaxID=274614 RepID=UPI0021187AE2|nr:39S ribosomal protein L4, mitochondrial [Schistocerca cancellata]